MKNRLSDLSDHLFAQLERLTDEDITPEDLDKEIKRSMAVVELSDQIVGNANTALRAADLFGKHGKVVLQLLPQIGQQTIETKTIDSPKSEGQE